MDFEEDPAAAFLAREQDELADIAGETLGTSSTGNLMEVWPCVASYPSQSVAKA